MKASLLPLGNDMLEWPIFTRGGGGGYRSMEAWRPNAGEWAAVVKQGDEGDKIFWGDGCGTMLKTGIFRGKNMVGPIVLYPRFMSVD
jgi:hypothetical protein